MLAFFYASAFVLLFWAPFVYYHREVHGVVNPTHCALTLFNAVNVLICLWEHALFLHRDRIRKHHAALKKRHGDRTLPSPLCLFERITPRQALSYEYWSVIWSTYSLLDPSYANQTSFGFWIDTGNGVVTLAPTLLLSVGATWDLANYSPLGLSNRALGVLGVVINYQMLYGTVLYFGNYCLNAYYRKTAGPHVATVVVANAIWIAFPAMWMRVCWEMVATDACDALRS
jgi:hypothetical protein|tara:strand:- start:45 stop:731 length:687 start_codon:yes stop_codon:yes gene_type:complete